MRAVYWAMALAFGASLSGVAPKGASSTQAVPPVGAKEGETLLERMLQAHGGLDSFRAIRDWHIVADRKLRGGDVREETYEEWFHRDISATRTLLVKRRPGERLVYGHDGVRGFAFRNDVRRTDEGAAGEAYYRAHGEYYLRAIPFKWADPGVRVFATGREGEDTVLLRVEADETTGPASQDVWVAAIDARTWRLREARLTHHRGRETWMDPPNDSIVEITYRYSDYRRVGAIWIPYRLQYVSGGKVTGVNVIRRIELDVGLSAADFEPERFASPRDRQDYH